MERSCNSTTEKQLTNVRDTALVMITLLKHDLQQRFPTNVEELDHEN